MKRSEEKIVKKTKDYFSVHLEEDCPYATTCPRCMDNVDRIILYAIKQTLEQAEKDD